MSHLQSNGDRPAFAQDQDEDTPEVVTVPRGFLNNPQLTEDQAGYPP
jgi:hypothetical protein